MVMMMMMMTRQACRRQCHTGCWTRCPMSTFFLHFLFVGNWTQLDKGETRTVFNVQLKTSSSLQATELCNFSRDIAERWCSILLWIPKLVYCCALLYIVVLASYLFAAQTLWTAALTSWLVCPPLSVDHQCVPWVSCPGCPQCPLYVLYVASTCWPWVPQTVCPPLPVDLCVPYVPYVLCVMCVSCVSPVDPRCLFNRFQENNPERHKSSKHDCTESSYKLLECPPFPCWPPWHFYLLCWKQPETNHKWKENLRIDINFPQKI